MVKKLQLNQPSNLYINYYKALFLNILYIFLDTTQQKFIIEGELTKPEATKIGILDGTNVVAYTYVIKSGSSKQRKNTSRFINSLATM